MLFFLKKQKSKEAEELEENSDAVIVVNYLEENNAMEEKKTMRQLKNQSIQVKKQPVVQSEIASEDPRDEISEYDVFENLKEIEIENGYI